MADTAGLILLAGPPASGKSSSARAWVEQGRLDAIRSEMFGTRVQARLAVILPVLVDATKVTPAPDDRPPFRAADERLPRRNAARSGPARRSFTYAVTAVQHATRETPLAEGVTAVPGESSGHTPAHAAALIRLTPRSCGDVVDSALRAKAAAVPADFFVDGGRCGLAHGGDGRDQADRDGVCGEPGAASGTGSGRC
ncbi:hypothetical protein GCM10010168_17790 [Actinoplanes ianthinogenes]|uniref:AAA domain-containing protein n=2 Tax=Actinoplanes ianthinogenes TaxID=122358 RepID=A0ABM7M6Z5_9ACTN|nr:hypothetical protein Aiant_80780 [Actinoplanes ianthinogenes]GGR01685.1 hypothetical protein GCM10010168_17790 [Actinoplanes ianthinogenes]